MGMADPGGIRPSHSSVVVERIAYIINVFYLLELAFLQMRSFTCCVSLVSWRLSICRSKSIGQSPLTLWTISFKPFPVRLIAPCLLDPSLIFSFWIFYEPTIDEVLSQCWWDSNKNSCNDSSKVFPHSHHSLSFHLRILEWIYKQSEFLRKG